MIQALKIVRHEDDFVEAEVFEKIDDKDYKSVGGVSGKPMDVKRAISRKFPRMSHLIFMDSCVSIASEDLFDLSMQIADFEKD